jgi:hypothetical protein
LSTGGRFPQRSSLADERLARQRLRPVNVNKAFDSIEIYQRWKTFHSS